MDANTKTMMLTLATGVIKKGLLVAGTGLASHGVINSNQTETFVSIGMVLVGAGWSFWNDYGKAIVLSQLEVLKAKSLAQAAKLKDNGIKPVTVNEIAAQHDTLTPADVTKTIASLPPDPKATVAKVGAVAVVLLMFGLAFPQPATAQLTGNMQADIAAAAAKRKPLTGNIVNDIAAAKGGAVVDGGKNALDAAAAALAKPFQDIAAFVGEDADRAVTLSTAIPEIQDGHGQQCWIAMASFGKIIQAHPVPLTLHIMNDFETLRLLAIATNRLCTNVHCTQVFADGGAMAQAASPIPLLVPSLHDLCTKVPQIALVDPVPAPVTPSPSATPTPAPPAQ